MENEFISIDGDQVIIKIKGSSLQLSELEPDIFYNLLLQDILKVMQSYSTQRAKKFSLCPRWLSRHPHRRDIHVSLSGESPFVEGVPLGVIRIDNHELENSYNFEKAHNYERVFRLSFHPAGKLNFIKHNEFYDIYNKVIK